MATAGVWKSLNFATFAHPGQQWIQDFGMRGALERRRRESFEAPIRVGFGEGCFPPQLGLGLDCPLPIFLSFLNRNGAFWIYFWTGILT